MGETGVGEAFLFARSKQALLALFAPDAVTSPFTGAAGAACLAPFCTAEHHPKGWTCVVLAVAGL